MQIVLLTKFFNCQRYSAGFYAPGIHMHALPRETHVGLSVANCPRPEFIYKVIVELRY